MIDKTITYKGQLSEYKIQITQSDRFSECTDKEHQDSPLGVDMTTVMPPEFDIKKVPAIILKGEVLKEDQFAIWKEIDHTKSHSSTEALLDDLIRKEAQVLHPDAKLVNYSTRTCNHYQRQHCYILYQKQA
jgi:hypothetical protein